MRQAWPRQTPCHLPAHRENASHTHTHGSKVEALTAEMVSPQPLDDDLPLPEMLALDKPSGSLAVGSVRFKTGGLGLDA